MLLKIKTIKIKSVCNIKLTTVMLERYTDSGKRVRVAHPYPSARVRLATQETEINMVYCG